MIDIYTEHHPHQHPVEPIEHLKMVGAQYYTSLLSKLTSHINNTDVHVTNEDKVKWEKAFLDIKDLKDKVDDIDTDKSGSKDIDLTDYATKAWVESQGYAYENKIPTFDDLKQYATITYVDNVIKGIVPSIPSGDYVTEKELKYVLVDYATAEDLTKTEDQINETIHNLQQSLEDQIDSITSDEYQLPIASQTTLGGIKVNTTPPGSDSSTFPVKVTTDGIAYVKVPFSTQGGDELVATEMYSIQVVNSTVQNIIYNDAVVLDGDVSWIITKTQGTSVNYVQALDEGVSTYAISTPSNTQFESLPINFSNNYHAPMRVARISASIAAANDVMIRIVVEKNGIVVASVAVPIARNGKDGESVIQTIPDAMIRLKGEYLPNVEYSSGRTADENGYKWIDIVSYQGMYFKCLHNGICSPPIFESGEYNKAQWDRFGVFKDAAFDAIIANYLSARSITAEQIVVLKDYSTSNPTPVAGIVGKNKYSYNGQEYDIVRTTGPIDVNNPVVIFAGTEGNNITNAPFRVYQDGSLFATNAKITGSLSSIELEGSPDGIHQNTVQINNDNIKFESSTLPRGYVNVTKIGDDGASFYNGVNETTIDANGIKTPSIEVEDITITGNLNYNGDILGNNGIDLWIQIGGNHDGKVLLEFKNGSLVNYHMNQSYQNYVQPGDHIILANTGSGEFKDVAELIV